ncbi:MAG: stage II sporulation protein P [Ignavibacteriales bacterium]
MLDEQGEVLFHTSLPVSVGDQFIGRSNRTYTVREVTPSTARAVTVMWEHDLPGGEPRLVTPATTPAGVSAMPLGLASRVVVIYHTHTDESYEPTEGRPSAPALGGVVAVGDAFRQALEGIGYAVVHDKTPHTPHDALAYARSRRTAYSNLRYRPYMLFDIHRDSGPAESYVTNVEGKPASQIMLVVGRQNPLVTANLGVARRLKAAADAAYPGLVKGIFLAQGHYNQDLDPGALLLEVGTDKVPRDLAERAMAFFAQVVARAFGAPGV